MGVVWLAYDEYLRREVAVKEILPRGRELRDTDPEVRRALREARAAAKLSKHPGIITVHDVVTDDSGLPWIVMELLQGRSLRAALEADGPMRVEQAARIGIQLLAALDYAHGEGVLHRDVKPGNVMLVEDQAVLTDFGIAVLDGVSVLTATGQIPGSPEYVAPERIRGEETLPAADLWSVGVMLYTMVVGRGPFQRADIQATMGAALTMNPDPDPRVGRLTPAIDGLLRKNPAERMTARQAIAALTPLTTAGHFTGEESQAPNSAPPHHPPSATTRATPDAPTLDPDLTFDPAPPHTPAPPHAAAPPLDPVPPHASTSPHAPNTPLGPTPPHTPAPPLDSAPPLSPASPPDPGPSHDSSSLSPFASRGSVMPRFRRGPLVVAGAALVVVAVVVAIVLSNWSPGDENTAVPTTTTNGSRAPLETHREPLGFVIDIPEGWQRSSSAEGPVSDVTWEGPQPEPTAGALRVQVVRDTTVSGTSAYTYLYDEDQTQSKNQDKLDYHTLTLADHGESADLEYTYRAAAGSSYFRVRMRAFAPEDEVYTLTFSTFASNATTLEEQWRAAEPLFAEIRDSFQLTS
jgi:eukaryotic-like serine/threonine-protein kinase